MNRYEFVEGKSSKFWEYEVQGSKLLVRFGRIGSDGQSSEKKFASAGEANAAAEKLVAEKTGKGYVAAKGASKPKPKPAPAKPPKASKGAASFLRAVEPTTRIFAKAGRAYDVTKEKPRPVNVAKVEARLGGKLGEVLRNFIALSEAVQADSPAEAFGPTARHGDLIFDVFLTDPAAIDAYAKPPLLPFATDHKTTYAFLPREGEDSDGWPVVLVDHEGGEDPAIVADDLASFLSQLAFGFIPDYLEKERQVEVERLQRNLRLLPGVDKKKRGSKLSKTTRAIELAEILNPTPPEPPGKKYSLKELVAKAHEACKVAFKDKKKGLKLVREAHARFAHVKGGAEYLGWMESQELELLLELKRKKEAAELWLKLAKEWERRGPEGSTDYYALGEAQNVLKLKIPPELKPSILKNWSLERLRFYERRESEEPKKDVPAKSPPSDPMKAKLQAKCEIRLKRWDMVKACAKVARKLGGRDEDEAELYSIYASWRAGDFKTGRRELEACVKRFAKSPKDHWPWDDALQLYTLLEMDAPALRKTILAGWDKSRDGDTQAAMVA